jgi:2-polyprenyl-3-methyl-5-hydroxy-6-metoxy-1,4-benzoquinol methylase
MNDYWDERYKTREYIYGKKPNEFFKQELLKLKPGKILLPAEGEGRNAVFASLSGWKVIAFDSSSVAKKKAERLAKANQVTFDYQITDFQKCKFEKESFDTIALIYAHIHELERREIHHKLLEYLAPGGTLILEAFSQAQIHNNSGGPKVIEALYIAEELKVDFLEMKNLHCWEESVKLSEGKHHKGIASIIRLIGTK